MWLWVGGALGGRGSVLQRDASLQGVRPRHSWGRTEEAAARGRGPGADGRGRAGLRVVARGGLLPGARESCPWLRPRR